MLPPEYFDILPRDFYYMIQDLNDDIVIMFIEYLVSSNMDIDKIVAISNEFESKTNKMLNEYEKKSNNEFEKVLTLALAISIQTDKKYTNVEPTKTYQKELVRLMLREQYESKITNLTQTTALYNRQTNTPMPYREALIREFDSMYASVVVGNNDYASAMRRTIRNLDAKGVIYSQNFYINERGKVIYSSLEVITRRALFGGIKNIVAEQANENARILNTNTFQISLHSGNRPTHGWGGKRWNDNGEFGYPTQEQLYQMYAINGEVGRLTDYGCRHSYFGILPDAPIMYSNEEIKKHDQLEAERKDWKGKKYNKYEQTQVQRYYERQIRKTKKNIRIESAIESGSPLELKKQLQDNITSLRTRYRLQIKEYRTFCEAMGLNYESNRFII